MRRPAVIAAATLAACSLAALAGCAGLGDSGRVKLTRHEADTGVRRIFVEHPGSVLYAADSRGLHTLAARWSSPGEQGPIEQVLLLQELHPMRPGETGTADTMLNARVSYLIRTPSPGESSPADRCYQGVGSVLVRSAWWRSGRHFEIRHALLQLRRSSHAGLEDPLGAVELSADLWGDTASDAAEQIAAARELIEEIPPAAPPSQ